MSEATKRLISLYSARLLELEKLHTESVRNGDSTDSILNEVSTLLRKIVSWHGVPTPKKFGSDASFAAVYFVSLLGEDRRFQELFLYMMYQSKEFPETSILLLEQTLRIKGGIRHD